MSGTNAYDGKTLDGQSHLRQSIRDILTTAIGERVMRRDYGSELPLLVDAPINRSTLAALYAATANALRQWEPRFSLAQITLAAATPSSVVIDLVGIYMPTGDVLSVGVEVSA